MDYVADLRDTIERVHGCRASHSRTESVTATVEGRTVASGKIEVFALLGHDHALRCYAWGGMDANGCWEVTTVLAIPPVISAETAVVAAIAAASQQTSG